jgi:hypothetical protein
LPDRDAIAGRHGGKTATNRFSYGAVAKSLTLYFYKKV